MFFKPFLVKSSFLSVKFIWHSIRFVYTKISLDAEAYIRWIGTDKKKLLDCYDLQSFSFHGPCGYALGLLQKEMVIIYFLFWYTSIIIYV